MLGEIANGSRNDKDCLKSIRGHRELTPLPVKSCPAFFASPLGGTHPELIIFVVLMKHYFSVVVFFNL